MENALPPQCLVFDPDHESPNLTGCLTALGYRVTTANLPEVALRAVAPTPHHLAFVAVRSRDPASFELISTLLARCHGLDVVAVVRAADIEAALEAGRRGARCCMASPVAFADVDQVIERIAQQHPEDAGVDSATSSAAMRAAMNAALKAASRDTPVLFTGEPGSGQEQLARLMHEQSPRADKPFTVLPCADVPQDKLATELAEHARAAGGGTLFIDEVGELPAEAQAWLVKYLGSGETGSARVVASTSRDLDDPGSGPRFSAEAHHGLSVVTIEVPPLRKRPEDILALAGGALAALAARMGRPTPELGESARATLLAHGWPGNLPELDNELERALVMTSGSIIEANAFSSNLRPATQAAPYVGGDFTIQEIERAHIERVLARTRTFDGAAQLLGIDDSTLWRKRKRYANGASRSNGNSNGNGAHDTV